MEFHSPAAAKKMWSFLRVALFMMRKGLISKRKMIVDMNLMMKRGKLLLGKSLGNLIFHHHSRPRGLRGEYEFSCSNSPNPVFFHAKRRARHHNYFPCINVDETPRARARAALVMPRIEYSPQPSFQSQGESPSSPLPSPLALSIRVSNYSSSEEEEEEEEEIENDGQGQGQGQEVDNDAEEFIRRFYEQLRAQRRIALLQYQEMEYQEMLARGS